MAVPGIPHPAPLRLSAGAQPGDRLVLTKPIGTGVLSSAVKEDRVDDATIDVMVASMVTLNDAAARAAHDAGCKAATDVTGYGLLGHLREMLEASGCAAIVDAAGVPLLPRARALAAPGVLSGGSRRNLDWVS